MYVRKECFLINLVELVQNDNVEAISNLKNEDLQECIRIALNESNITVANHILDQLDDVNFMVDGALEGWKMPLVHHSITTTMMNSRFPRPAAEGPKNDGVIFQAQLAILKIIIDLGADMSSTDTYGNLPIMRAVLDALAIDLSITDDEFDEDLEIVFELLIDSGCDLRERTNTRSSVLEMFRNNAVLTYIPQ